MRLGKVIQQHPDIYKHIEVVEDFNHLGIKYRCTRTLSFAFKSLKDQTLRAYNSTQYHFVTRVCKSSFITIDIFSV